MVHPQGSIDFQFKEIDEKDVPTDVGAKFAPDTMRVCFQGNKQMAPTVDTTQDLPDDPHSFSSQRIVVVRAEAALERRAEPIVCSGSDPDPSQSSPPSPSRTPA